MQRAIVIGLVVIGLLAAFVAGSIVSPIHKEVTITHKSEKKRPGSFYEPGGGYGGGRYGGY